MVQFSVEGDDIVLTDQKPIIEANIAFQGGWTMADLIEAINRRVFFWRGRDAGLLSKDQGHHGKYEAAGHALVFLRMPMLETIELNSSRGPEVCKYNSGAARRNQGERIPRGPHTFVTPRLAGFSRRDVREVVFHDFVDLPASTQCCEGTWEGPWSDFFVPGEATTE